MIFRKILDGDPTKIKNVTKNCWKTVVFSFGTASITSTRQFGPGAENHDFGREYRPDRSKSQRLNTFFGKLPRAGAQNSAQNSDFSENLLYWSNWRKSSFFFSFRTVWIIRDRRRKNDDFGAENRPNWSKSRKMNSCWSKSPQYSVQNRVQNRDFSENKSCDYVRVNLPVHSGLWWC